MAFLERKLRVKRHLMKRRTPVGLDEIARLAAIESEVWGGGWFHRRLQLRHLQPVCQVSYRRIARTLTLPRGEARLTLDDDLRARRATAWEIGPRAGLLVAPHHVIVEIKFVHPMPAVFRELAATFALRPDRISKYRLSAQALGLAVPESDMDGAGAIACRNS